MSRKSGLVGVAFAVLFTAYGFLDNGPSQDLSNASTQAWYAHHSLTQWLISTAFGALAGVCAIMFAVMLRQRLAAAGDRSAAVQLVTAGGMSRLRLSSRAARRHPRCRPITSPD